MADDANSNPLDLDIHNAEYVEQVLEDYIRDASSVPPFWQQYFSELSGGNGADSLPRRRPSFQPSSVFNPLAIAKTSQRSDNSALVRQQRVDELVDAYRTFGHLAAKLDPLGLAPRKRSPIDPANYGLGPADLDRDVIATIGGGTPLPVKLSELIDRLTKTYCGFIGFDYMHIADRNVREWMQKRIEQVELDKSPPREIQLRILTRLTDAVIFEEFVRKKYLGAKRFRWKAPRH